MNIKNHFIVSFHLNKWLLLYQVNEILHFDKCIDQNTLGGNKGLFVTIFDVYENKMCKIKSVQDKNELV